MNVFANVFALVPALGMDMDPVLAPLDTLLDEDRLFQAVKADHLARRFPCMQLDAAACSGWMKSRAA
jgi:hypothetical protein